MFTEKKFEKINSMNLMCRDDTQYMRFVQDVWKGLIACGLAKNKAKKICSSDESYNDWVSSKC